MPRAFSLLSAGLAVQDVDISTGGAPVAVSLHSSDVSAPHFNKYGQEYSPDNPKSY